jgi:hypothetical protein
LKELKKKNTIDPEMIILQELLVPTVHSDLINVNYFLEIHFGHKGMTFGSKLKPAVLPIYIYAPIVPKSVLKFKKPDNWNPIRYNPVHLVVADQ